MDAADVKAEAGTMLAGPMNIAIPPGVHTLSHECEMTTETTGFALFPRMHQLGKHFKTTVTVGGVSRVLHEGDYDFSEQAQMPIEPIHFMPGDKIATECTYENPGPSTVTFGESSDTEMCFSVFFSYPTTGRSFCGRPVAR